MITWAQCDSTKIRHKQKIICFAHPGLTRASSRVATSWHAAITSTCWLPSSLLPPPPPPLLPLSPLFLGPLTIPSSSLRKVDRMRPCSPLLVDPSPASAALLI